MAWILPNDLNTKECHPAKFLRIEFHLIMVCTLSLFFSNSLIISLSLNKGNYDRDSVWTSDLNQHRFLRFCFCLFSLFSVLIEEIYQTLRTVFDHISKHLEVHQKYSAACCIFNSLLGVWKCGQTQSFVFDILLESD